MIVPAMADFDLFQAEEAALASALGVHQRANADSEGRPHAASGPGGR